MSETTLNRIGGSARPARSGETFPNVNPATGEVIGPVARSGAEDVADAAAAARAANWALVPPGDRADLLDRAADLLEAHAEELAALESRDTGKPIALARRIDIPRAVANFRFFAGALRHDETGFHRMAGALNYTIRKPLGVVGLITPWNLPLYLLTWKTAPALAMGNTVVAKPSELTPGTATALADLLAEAGLPAGAFNVVHGYGAQAGEPLVRHEAVRAVSFTGGTETGRRVAAAAAPAFKKLSLELGGKNPTIVFADADFETAVEGAVRAGFTNQGQLCLCGSRLLVQREIADRFTEAVVARVRETIVGDPLDPATEMGSLISREHREKVEGFVAAAVKDGGEILAGGARPDLPGKLAEGAFYLPTVVAGLAASSRAASEEIFGPVITVHTFADEGEAIRLANGVRYGLSASLFTRDLDRAHRVAAKLEAGMVWVNTWLLRDLRVPFGGVKESGVGREGGRWSLEFFSEAVNVCVKLTEEA